MGTRVTNVSEDSDFAGWLKLAYQRTARPLIVGHGEPIPSLVCQCTNRSRRSDSTP
jgi:hypothetical protein